VPFAEVLDDDNIILTLPGLKNAEWLDPLLFQSRAKLTLRIADRVVDPCGPAAEIPPDAEVLRAVAAAPKTMLVVQRRVELAGEHFAEFSTVRDKGAGPALAVRLNRLGQDRLARVTRSNVGQVLAIVLDNEVIAAATIREPIVDDAVLFSGGLTMEQAHDIARLMRIGMPWGPLVIMEQRIVEPRQ
jgi:preprotein translocase subunit SecD